MIIIILGTGIDQKGRLSKETARRLKEGKRIHEQSGSPLLLSGKYAFPPETKNHSQITEAEVMRDYLTSLGVLPDKILLDKESQDTIFSAYYAKTKHLISLKEKKAVIVTSDIHLERVEYIFFKVFGEEYDLHFIGMPSSLPCQSKGMIFAKQNILTEKVKNLLDDIKEGDHEAVRERALQSKHLKEKPDWSNIDYKKTC